MTDLNSYMAMTTRAAAKTALRAGRKNKRERRFIRRFMAAAGQKQSRRAQNAKDGIEIPPFLICSVATRCNLSCAGCYARAGGSCGQDAAGELPAERWRALFAEADELGVGFIILAGGEPLLRPELLNAAAEFPELLFLVFTNATLFDGPLLELFDQNRNLLPVLSIEGDEAQTDGRRGDGVFKKINAAMAALCDRDILFGTSITMTTQNLEYTTSPGYADFLRRAGSRLLFYIEYVPAEPGTQALAPGEAERERAESRLDALRRRFKDMVVVAFPGDEKKLDGCLAAGRGFVHIDPMGQIEPCPFAPVSDTALGASLREALRSPFLAELRQSGILDRPHAGGCVLHQYKDEMESLRASAGV